MRLSAKNMWMQLYCHFFDVHNSCINDNECYRVCQGFWPSLSKNWYNNFLACFICKLDSSQVEIKIKIRRNLFKKNLLWLAYMALCMAQSMVLALTRVTLLRTLCTYERHNVSLIVQTFWDNIWIRCLKACYKALALAPCWLKMLSDCWLCAW